MKIEILYPEFLIYGDRGNVDYLEKIFNDDNLVYTHYGKTPYFVSEDVDMIFMGPMTEKQLYMTTELLLPHKDRIVDLIENDKIFLIVGTALEMFGKYIETPDGNKLKTLNVFPFVTKRDMGKRHDTTVLGDFNGMKIMGYDARFTEQYGNDDMPFLTVERGYGFNKKSKLEGVKYKNFFGTNLYGPILVLNPPFLKYILKLLGQNKTIPFEETAEKAYELRLDKFTNENEFKD